VAYDSGIRLRVRLMASSFWPIGSVLRPLAYGSGIQLWNMASGLKFLALSFRPMGSAPRPLVYGFGIRLWYMASGLKLLALSFRPIGSVLRHLAPNLQVPHLVPR